MRPLFRYFASAIMASDMATAASPADLSAAGQPCMPAAYYPHYFSHFSYPLYTHTTFNKLPIKTIT